LFWIEKRPLSGGKEGEWWDKKLYLTLCLKALFGVPLLPNPCYNNTAQAEKNFVEEQYEL
jgi:hypothetical protein